MIIEFISEFNEALCIFFKIPKKQSTKDFFSIETNELLIVLLLCFYQLYQQYLFFGGNKEFVYNF